MPSLAPQGDRLSTFRRVLGLTQFELAVRSGVSERTIRNAERGRPIKRDFLQYIAAGLGVPMDDVIQASTELSSQLRWQRNLDNLMTAVSDLFSENPSLEILDFAHRDVICRVQGSIPGLARGYQIFTKFEGVAGLQQFVANVREIQRRWGEVNYFLEKPVGGGETVVLRCRQEMPLQNGELTWSRSVFVCEFEMLRLRRVDIYIAHDEHIPPPS